MPETAQERTEEATPRRRQQARKKGTVAKSQELTGAIVIVAMIAVLPSVFSNLGAECISSLRTTCLNMPSTLTAGTLLNSLWGAARGPAFAMLPLVSVAMVVGVAANFAQVGFVMSGEALTPSFAKINPVNGLKRLFSAQATIEGLKALAKSALFGWIAWRTVDSYYPQLAMLGWKSPGTALGLIGTILTELTWKIGFAWLVLAGLDYFFQRQQVSKQLRMSKDELKQEMKEMEQSPELRSAIAQRRRRLSRRLMESVKTADAVVTNPTHYAIAIKYETGKMHAPQVVAKGADLIAARIREIASEHRIPLVPNPPLARQLYKKCEVGDFVPRELFQAVAEVLAYVYKTIGSKR